MNASRNAGRSVFLSALLSGIASSALAATTYNVTTLPHTQADSADSYGSAIGPTG